MPNYGVLYLSGQASLLQGGAAQGGVKFQKYYDPNQPASAKRATPPKKHATNTSAPLLSSPRMDRCPQLSVKSYGTHAFGSATSPYAASRPKNAPSTAGARLSA